MTSDFTVHEDTINNKLNLTNNKTIKIVSKGTLLSVRTFLAIPITHYLEEYFICVGLTYQSFVGEQDYKQPQQRVLKNIMLS